VFGLLCVWYHPVQFKHKEDQTPANWKTMAVMENSNPELIHCNCDLTWFLKTWLFRFVLSTLIQKFFNNDLVQKEI